MIHSLNSEFAYLFGIHKMRLASHIPDIDLSLVVIFASLYLIL
jgi:hypothetical protein